MNKGLLIASIISIVLIILVVMLFIKYNSNNVKKNYSNIQKATITDLIEPPDNMKCTYYLDLNVYFSGSSRKIHVIHDRTSPIIKLNMANGNLIIEYLTSAPNQRYIFDTTTHETTEMFTNFSYIEHFTHPIKDENAIENKIESESENNVPESCECPPAIPKKPQPPMINPDKDISVMKVVTPSISFQRRNYIEIRQNIRMIDVYLNNKLLHTALLKYIPYLYPSKGTLLPNDAGRYIRINKFNFDHKFKE